MEAEHGGSSLGNMGALSSGIKEGKNEVTSNVHGTMEEKESGKGL